MTKSFSILKKIKGKKVGLGCILCQCDKKIILSENVIALPVEFV